MSGASRLQVTHQCPSARVTAVTHSSARTGARHVPLSCTASAAPPPATPGACRRLAGRGRRASSASPAPSAAPSTTTTSSPAPSSQRAYDLLQDKFPAFAGADARVVVHTDDRHPRPRPPWRPHSSGCRPPSTTSRRSRPRGRQPGRRHRGDHRAVRRAGHRLQGRQRPGPARGRGQRDLTERGYQVELGGQMPENISTPGGTAEMVGIGVALLILFLAFGSFVAAGLPIGIALVGLGDRHRPASPCSPRSPTSRPSRRPSPR